MSAINWQQHIQIDPELHHGDPCIRGTRIPVSTILGSMADGMTPADMQSYYPQLSAEDIHAALAYATPSVLESLEELEDIQAYDLAKLQEWQFIPFEEAVHFDSAV